MKMRTAVHVLAAAGCAAVVGLSAQPATATEGGASIYLLGSGGPGAAILPPIEGVFFANTLYYYSGEMGGDARLPIGGSVAAGVDATIVADFATLLWVPTNDFAGGTLALGAALPFGEPSVDVDVVITGPGGNQVGLSASDSAFVVGDPLLTASLGWTRGKVHTALSGLVNVPIGQYREDELANLSFHRWAGDVSLATTWHDPRSGWDVSAKVGYTVNGENDHTDYNSGNEVHLEAAVEKTFSQAFSAGLQAYHAEQITGDGGAGAALGPFKGRVSGAGLTAAYNFELAKRPASLRLHVLKEFEVENRPEGEAVWLDFTIPLVMKLPGA